MVEERDQVLITCLLPEAFSVVDPLEQALFDERSFL